MFIPPGWPEQVLPPSEIEWEASAVGFLLDCCPPDYRGYPLLRRQPVVLARFAAQFVESQLRATVDVLQREEARLVRLRRAVMLVEETLRGKIFIARL
ncbi:Uncharacterised protein [Mycobacteroides abscessus subsp. abscessus]|nr:Uncharacterised protein [Mycobacteroides abscessus subsp. abscessus]